MNKINNFLNTLSILATLFILALCYWARMGLPSYVTPVNYFSLFALASTLFILPDFLCYYFPAGTRWYKTSEFYTGGLVLLLGICGVVLSPFAAWIGFIIIPIGIALALWQLSQFVKNRSFLPLLAGVVFMVLMILLFYSQDHHSLLFPERIISGKAHMDTLYHITMSNMFSTVGWASTGLNGTPYIPYHWGTHVLFAGLKNWAGLTTMMFYNLAYPAIFLPLFIKSLFNFLYRLSIYKGIAPLNILLAVSFMMILYSLPVAGFDLASPIISESYCIAILFTFLFGSVVLSYITYSSEGRILFFWFALVTLILISFLKISNGLIFFIGMAYLYLRRYWNLKSIMIVFTVGIVLILVTYLFIYQAAYIANPATLPSRIIFFWALSGGFIFYFTGALIAMIVIMKNNSLESWGDFTSMIRSREYIDMEILFILTIAGVLGGIYTTSNPPDVYYFCTIQLFISIPFLILFTQKYFDRFRTSEKVQTIFLFLVIILSIVSKYDIKKGLADITMEKKELHNLTQQQKGMQEFLTDLFRLEKESSRETSCIYIPQTEKWYYESQSYRPFGSPLVVPAISGIAMIGGVPDTILKSDFNGHGYYYYKKSGQIMARNLIEAKNTAIKEGYHELIEYQFMDGKLNKQTFNLQTQY
jgi:hypothetical protein